jgi:hypothetical protein
MWLWRHEKTRLFSALETIMASEQDLQNDLDAIKAGVDAAVAAAANQSKVIADLTAQLAAGSPVTQAQLDALDTEAKGIVTALTPPAPPTT